MGSQLKQPFLPLPKGSTTSQGHPSLGCGGGWVHKPSIRGLAGNARTNRSPTLGSRQNGPRCYRWTRGLAIPKKQSLLPGSCCPHKIEIAKTLGTLPRLANDFQLCMLPASTSGSS